MEHPPTPFTRGILFKPFYVQTMKHFPFFLSFLFLIACTPTNRNSEWLRQAEAQSDAGRTDSILTYLYKINENKLSEEESRTFHRIKLATVMNNAPEAVDKTISFNDISEDDWLDNDFTYIQMKSWVRFLDDIYNRTILNPDGDEEQGALGLNRKILLVKEKNAKIWGIIPLCDNMFKMSFWTNNQYVAAGVWGFLFAIIVLLFILWGVKRTLNYNQKNGGYKG